jgi:carboxylesterase
MTPGHLFSYVILTALAINGFILVGALIERYTTKTPNPWLEKAQSFNPQSTSPGVILLHGFGGSPLDVKPLAEALASRGYRVTVPILPFQSRRDFAYARGDWTPETMLNIVKTIAETEKNITQMKPVLVGFSMGGALAALACAEGLCSKVILIAPFFGNPKLCWAAPILKYIMPIIPKYAKGQIRSPEGYARYTPGSYFVSSASFQALCNLGRLASSQVQKIDTPMLVFGSGQDIVASFSVTRQLLADRRDAKIETVHNANHVLLYDFGHTEIINKALAFISRSESTK